MSEPLRSLSADPAARLQPSDGPRWDMAFDVASAVVGSVMLMLIALTFQDYGITWDETWHLSYGRHIIHWFASGFVDDSALYYRADYLYGGAFDGLGYLARQISPLGTYETIHLFGALVGCVGLLGAWKLGRLLGGPAAGFLTLVLLILTPVWYGHMFNNPKDLPFAVGYIWALYYLVRILIVFPSVPTREWLKTSVALGIAMSVRIGGILTVCYLMMLIGLWILWRVRQTRDWSLLPRYVAQFATPYFATVAGAWLLMLVLWPWAQLAPLRRPFIVLARMSAFNLHERSMPFGWRRVSTLTPPPDYLLRYFVFKLPEIVLVLLVGALVAFIVRLVRLRRRAKALGAEPGSKAARRAPKGPGLPPLARERRMLAVWGLIAFAILFPPVYAIIKRSPLYDGLRHFLFLVPPMTVIAAVTFAQLTRWLARRSRAGAWALQTLVLAHAVRVILAMVHLHPHQYLYFNAFTGGLPGAYLRYSTDYYGNTYKEAYDDLHEYLWENDRERYLAEPYIISACMPQFVAKEYFKANFEWRRRGGTPPDFWLGYTRNNCYLQKEQYPELLRVEREGTLLVLVRDMRLGKEGWEPPDPKRPHHNVTKGRDEAKGPRVPGAEGPRKPGSEGPVPMKGMLEPPPEPAPAPSEEGADEIGPPEELERAFGDDPTVPPAGEADAKRGAP